MRNSFLGYATLILLVAAGLRLAGLHAYPPGPHYDEAVNLLIARSITYGGARPFPIVEAYQGREVLYMYANAALLPALGDRMFTLQLTNAWLNLVTIAASIALGRVMFRGRRGWVIGLAVGVLMALSFPQVWLARQAFRAVTLPLCQALALLFLWRGLRSRRGWGWLVAGGLFGGLALYTYMASRLFPVWLLLAGIALLLIDRPQLGLRLRQGLVFFGMLAVIVLPMGLYALEKPDIFLGRLDEVTQPEQSITLAESVGLHLRMFFLEGDPYLRYNIPGRPYFTLPEGLLLLAGLCVALWRSLRARLPLERVAYFLAWLSPVMIIPSVISVGGYPPSHMRSLGMVPLVFVLVAVGFEALWRVAVVRRYRRAPVFALILIAVLVGGGLLVGSAYVAWAGRADLYYESDADLAAVGAWLPENTDDRLVYVAARDRGHPTLQIAQTPPITWLGTESLFRPPPGQRGLVIFPRSAPPSSDWLAWLEQGRVDGLPLGPDGRSAFEAFVVSGDAPLPALDQPPTTPVENRFLRLYGTRVTATAGGTTALFETAWQVDAPPDAPDLTPLVQLEDANGVVLSRGDSYMTETDRWRAGEVLFQRHRLAIPHGTPPGDYALRLAWVARADDRYVPFGEGSVWATVDNLSVTRPTEFPDPSALSMDVSATYDFADGVRLLGWKAPSETRRPGEALPVTLFWQATPIESARASVHVEAVLMGERGELSLFRGEVLNERHPANRWQTGELLTEHAHWRLPRDLEAGVYTLELRTHDARVTLGEIRVDGLPRLFEAPEFAQPLDARFGGMIALAGMTPTIDSGSLALTLVWQALDTVDSNYTVFVHVINAAGEIVVQRDTAPHDGAYPTSLWLPGEYIVDPYIFHDLPTGQYTVRVGLYSQDSGRRLTAITSLPIRDNAVEVWSWTTDDLYR